MASRAATASTSTSTAKTAARLRHLRVASSEPNHEFPAYADVERLQSQLQRKLLSWKTAAAAAATNSDVTPGLTTTTAPPPPPPTVISFTPQPTYTLGRRQVAPLSDAERARLEAPLTVTSPSSQIKRNFTPAIHSAPRGGLATYHGPGQVVFWPVLDLHSPLHKGFTVRDYACLLEKTTIAALARFAPGLSGFTTENPGVWVRHNDNSNSSNDKDKSAGEAAAGGEETGGEDRKISALGVHLRRHVTGLGVAINFGMPVSGPEQSNPWARIVACGLGDKKVTTIAAETTAVGQDSAAVAAGHNNSDDDAVANRLADIWADEFAVRLGLEAGISGGAGAVERVVVQDVQAELDVD